MLFKQILDELFSNLKIDRNFLKDINRFQVTFTQKNDDHINFFSGVLTGVHVVRFTPSDFSFFFNEILDTELLLVQKLIKKHSINKKEKEHHLRVLDTHKPSDREYLESKKILEDKPWTSDWVVSSDPFNNVIFYLLNRVATEEHINDHDRVEGIINLGLILNYKLLTSLLSRYFPRPADENIANTTYTRLSERFLIKKHKSWKAVLIYRAERAFKNTGLHYETILAYDNNTDVVAAINDYQGRLRDLIKNIYDLHERIRVSGMVIRDRSSSGIDMEGDETISDKTVSLQNYVIFVNKTCMDEDELIKTDIIRLVLSNSSSTSESHLRKILRYIPTVYLDPVLNALISELIEKTILLSFNYLAKQGFIVTGKVQIKEFLTYLKGYYATAKNNDPDLIRLREIGDEIVINSLGAINQQASIAARTGLLLYIALLAYTMNHHRD